MSPARLPLFEYDQVLPLGFRLPARMSVLPLGAGKLALVSPIPIDDGLATALAALGRVEYLIAPNLLHHLYLPAAMQRYPGALVIAPARLREKKPDLRVDVAVEFGAPAPALPAELGDSVDVIPLRGAPALDELVIYHRATRTLVVTELVFNVTQPRGGLAHLVLLLVGCHGKLASSRAVRALVKDRTAARASVERVLALPFETLVMAHGEVIEADARARLERALGWLSPARQPRPLPASGA